MILKPQNDFITMNFTHATALAQQQPVHCVGCQCLRHQRNWNLTVHNAKIRCGIVILIANQNKEKPLSTCKIECRQGHVYPLFFK